MKALSLVLAAACWFSAAAQTPSKYALLIGIGTYEHAPAEIKSPGPGVPEVGRYEPGITYTNLTGPPNDVAAMKELLTSTKFGFPDDDKHIVVLPETRATHDGILKAMQRYMVDDRAAGDTAVLFISSHGSLRPYPAGQGPPDSQLYDLFNKPDDLRHVENTIVPYDWYTGADDIFSRDLRHIFNLAAAKGIHVTAIFDACHSGSISRGFERTKLVAKDFSFDPRLMTPDPFPKELAPAKPPQERGDNPVLIFSAAQKDQSAVDDESDNPAHGLFTSVLIDTLNALPADRPAEDVLKRVQIAMELAPGSLHPQPELDASPARRRQPVFGGAAGNGPATAAVVSVDDSGVLLDIGTAADIGPGSTFTALTGDHVTLEVTHSDLARSTTRITSTSKAIKPTDVVQLVKAVPWQRPSLLFFAGISNPPAADITAALAAVTSAELTLASDPSANAWTEHLAWDGTHWVLYSHSKLVSPGHTEPEKATVLGVKLGAAALKKVPPGSVVWFDPPLAKESTSALLPTTAIAAKLTSDRIQAKYVVGARLEGGAIEYAWFKRDDVDAEVLTPKGSGAGCSPNSAYPLRTDYTDPKLGTPEAALNDSAVQLARLNGWLQLQSSPVSSHEQFPYRFALQRDGTSGDISENGNTYKGDSYHMALVAAQPPDNPTPRWVYVLGVDCQGKGTVVWPYEGMPPGKFPPAGMGKAMRISLPGLPFPVDDPLGTDTYLLLTTSSPLANYNALNFNGVVTRSVGDKAVMRGANPLEDLLDDTSAGTRGAGGPIPTDWSVQPLQLQSLPGPAPH